MVEGCNFRDNSRRGLDEAAVFNFNQQIFKKSKINSESQCSRTLLTRSNCLFLKTEQGGGVLRLEMMPSTPLIISVFLSRGGPSRLV